MARHADGEFRGDFLAARSDQESSAAIPAPCTKSNRRWSFREGYGETLHMAQARRVIWDLRDHDQPVGLLSEELSKALTAVM